jgi:hypothetical protein
LRLVLLLGVEPCFRQQMLDEKLQVAKRQAKRRLLGEMRL